MLPPISNAHITHCAIIYANTTYHIVVVRTPGYTKTRILHYKGSVLYTYKQV
jgi:hypothetical protein